MRRQRFQVRVCINQKNEVRVITLKKNEGDCDKGRMRLVHKGRALSCETGNWPFLQWHLTRSSDCLQESIIPKNPDNLEFVQPAQCAHADDFAVASLSFRGLMTPLAPAFRSVDSIAGLNLNYRKCCWVHYGTEERDSLRTWLLANCEEFREMHIVRHAPNMLEQ